MIKVSLGCLGHLAHLDSQEHQEERKVNVEIQGCLEHLEGRVLLDLEAHQGS